MALETNPLFNHRSDTNILICLFYTGPFLTSVLIWKDGEYEVFQAPGSRKFAFPRSEGSLSEISSR